MTDRLENGDAGAVRYEVDRGKRKYLYLCISAGKVLVKAPLRMPSALIEKAVAGKEEWIRRKLAAFPPPVQEADGPMTSVQLFGIRRPIRMEICGDGAPEAYGAPGAHGAPGARLTADEVIVMLPVGQKEAFTEESRALAVRSAVEALMLRLASDAFAESFRRMTALSHLVPKSTAVRKLSRCWGRCTARGHISINPDLVAYPADVIDYVVLHELCHLRFLNHSADFKGLLDSLMPDWRGREESLRNCASR